MASTGTVDELLEAERTNAVLGWMLVAFVAVVAVQRLLTGRLLWAIVAAFVVALAVLPPIGYRDPMAMLPWEVLALGSVSALGTVIADLVTWSFGVRIATYLSVAALALIVAVELDLFTAVRMPPWFAVLFVVIATLATAGVLAVAQWLSDLYLGTTFLLDPALSEAEIERRVMWDFVAATAGGALAGQVFEWYFRRRARTHARLPEEVREAIE